MRSPARRCFPERVRAAATIAGVAPYDAEGLAWTEGMGESNQIEYPLAARDPDGLLRWMQPQVEALAAAQPDDIVSELRTLISEVDEAEVTGALGELMAASFRRAFANGVVGLVRRRSRVRPPLGVRALRRSARRSRCGRDGRT